MKQIKSIADLEPDDMNANLGSERGSYMLDDSLRKFGAGRSVLADKNGKLIAGNKTVEHAAQIGMDDVIVVETDGTKLVVVQRTDLDMDADPRARALAIADNRIAEVNLEWDAAVLKELSEENGTLDGLFSDTELDIILEQLKTDAPPEGSPEAQIDRATEWQAKYGAQIGQIWAIGRHRLLIGDCRDESLRSLLLDGHKPDLLNTDPPYGIGIVSVKAGSASDLAGGAKPFGSTSGAASPSSTGFDSRKTGLVGGGEPARHKWATSNAYPAIAGDRPRCTEPVQRGAKSKNQIIQSNIYPVIEGDDEPFDPTPLLDFAPIVILWGANYYADKLPCKSSWIVWDKREAITRNTFADCELAWCSRGGPARIFYHLWNGLHKGSQHGERRTHPTEKPVALFEEIGREYAPEGVWVDLYAGTGAQMVAAERSGATCLAAEIEPLYGATILERMSNLNLEVKLL